MENILVVAEIQSDSVFSFLQHSLAKKVLSSIMYRSFTLHHYQMGELPSIHLEQHLRNERIKAPARKKEIYSFNIVFINIAMS
jgi:hypothetical protein